mmetsp:Transcript_20307/g.42913  ORF Transcript_20307/g.42913 Transcript_20307/m.42913 type:complete len:274 (-) Transcript_20307:988-1809(-)
MSTTMAGKGIKGNDGKAARLSLTTQILSIFVLAVFAVAAIKTVGSGKWHSKAAAHEEHQLTNLKIREIVKDDSPPVADKSGSSAVLHQDDPNNNLIEITFSNLDGKEGSTGIVVLKLIPEWAPLGVERFKELTAASFWEGCRAFRVIPNFVVQLGINGDPSVQKTWRSQSFKDDPVKTTNARGTITFATSGKDTRTTQIFFNIGKSNAYLDKQGFSPFGEVIKGMDVIDRIYSEYREKPNQGLIQNKGNSYLEKEFPKLSFIKSARFVTEADI